MRSVLSISGLAVGTCWDAEQTLTMTDDQTTCPGGSDSHFKPLHLGLSMLPNSAGPLTSAGVWTCLKHVIVPFNSMVDVEDGSYTEHCLVRENDVRQHCGPSPARKQSRDGGKELIPLGPQFPYKNNSLKQWSRTFLAPATGFVEDGFSTDGGGTEGREVGGLGMIQAHCIQTHRLYSLAPNRPGPALVRGPEVGDPCSEVFSSCLKIQCLGLGILPPGARACQ